MVEGRGSSRQKQLFNERTDGLLKKKKKKKPSWFSTSCSSVLSCTISEGHFSESRWRKILYLKSGRVTEVQRVLSIYS